MNIKSVLKSKKAQLLIVAAVLLAALAAWGLSSGSSSPHFRSEPLKRGELQVTISATGTIEPEEVVDVGTQVAGRIIAFGLDQQGKAIDYGSYVEEGTVLARIDDALYASDVEQAQAQLKLAQAGLLEAQAKFAQAERDWVRAQKLGPSDALAHSSYDSYKAAYETTKAGVAVGEAQIAQAQATLDKAQQNLGYCTIKSPVSGVIIDRRVNIGQTVVSSLNAPSLFLMAKDLKRIQVWVAVNEADIGNITPGQAATFTVDAFPGEEFQAQVVKTRLNATMTQNVVTYTVELVTDNADGKLLPYLTANVRFEVSRHKQELLVPNAALRYLPKPELVLGTIRKAYQAALSATSPAAGQTAPGTSRVWTNEGKYLRPVMVKTGVTDGSYTAIEGQDLKEGMPIVVGEAPASAGADNTTVNPFTPQFGRGPGGGGRH
jgi:HlyD family secretion protein